MNRQPRSPAVVIPNWNGRRWLPGCLAALGVQTVAPSQVIVVDNGSDDDSVEYLRAEHPAVLVISLPANTGFAHAANVGLRAASSAYVALVNNDAILSPDWIERMAGALDRHCNAGSATGKMLVLDNPEEIDDAGDVLRRDGACEQRGRFHRDDGRWDAPGEIFGACAGAALYRRAPVLDLGGFDDRLFAYLEDVDLAVRLQLSGWRCRYEPAVALHGGGGSGAALARDHLYLVQRNTLFLVARYFPWSWIPQVAYRQFSWAWHAACRGRLPRHMLATIASIPLVVAACRERKTVRDGARVPIEEVVPPRPIRGSAAGGHERAIRASWR